MNLTEKNLLPMIHEYFGTLGLHSDAAAYFTSRAFDSGLVLKLPDVSLLPKNKLPHSKSKQTHIHVTGSNRYFFFPEYEIDAAVGSSDDKMQAVAVSTANIKNLIDRNSAQIPNLGIKDTFTLTKIAFRQSQETQVQISKIRGDGKEFISLREGLFVHDLLIFLKYKNQDKFFAIGIPFDFYNGKYDLPETGGYLEHLESPGNITVKSALQDAEKNTDSGAILTDSSAISDIIYQQLVDTTWAEDTPEDYVAEKYDASETEHTSTSNRPKTNPSLGKSAIRQSGYRCAFSTAANPHHTFIKPNGEAYMEVHHLIPLEQQVNFEYKLDTRANLVPLCPLCHKKIHYGRREDVTLMLEQLFQEREDLLKQSGLSLSLEDLKSFY